VKLVGFLITVSSLQCVVQGLMDSVCAVERVQNLWKKLVSRILDLMAWTSGNLLSGDMHIYLMRGAIGFDILV
jgi:hypothetical protein